MKDPCQWEGLHAYVVSQVELSALKSHLKLVNPPVYLGENSIPEVISLSKKLRVLNSEVVKIQRWDSRQYDLDIATFVALRNSISGGNNSEYIERNEVALSFKRSREHLLEIVLEDYKSVGEELNSLGLLGVHTSLSRHLDNLLSSDKDRIALTCAFENACEHEELFNSRKRLLDGPRRRITSEALKDEYHAIRVVFDYLMSAYKSNRPVNHTEVYSVVSEKFASCWNVLPKSIVYLHLKLFKEFEASFRVAELWENYYLHGFPEIIKAITQTLSCHPIQPILPEDQWSPFVVVRLLELIAELQLALVDKSTIDEKLAQLANAREVPTDTIGRIIDSNASTLTVITQNRKTLKGCSLEMHKLIEQSKIAETGISVLYGKIELLLRSTNLGLPSRIPSDLFELENKLKNLDIPQITPSLRIRLKSTLFRLVEASMELQYDRWCAQIRKGQAGVIKDRLIHVFTSLKTAASPILESSSDPMSCKADFMTSQLDILSTHVAEQQILELELDESIRSLYSDIQSKKHSISLLREILHVPARYQRSFFPN